MQVLIVSLAYILTMTKRLHYIALLQLILSPKIQ